MRKKTRTYSYDKVRVARWLSRDPIGERGGLNLYAYCMDDPTDGADSSGLKWDSQKCASVARTIENIKKEIQKRTGEMNEDPQTLPWSVPGDDVNPSLSKGGHLRLINEFKRDLAMWQGLYDANCKDDEPPTPPQFCPLKLPYVSPETKKNIVKGTAIGLGTGAAAGAAWYWWLAPLLVAP
jgi:hypothetical protein